MKKLLFLLVFLAASGGGGYAYYKYGRKPVEPTVNTGTISRGNIVDTVGTTGALSAVSQVQVGSQVSGIIVELGADFNQIVKKGQVLARLDPTTIETQILQAKANLIRSQTDLDRAKVTLADAQRKFARSKELLDKKLVPQSDYDAAELSFQSAQSSVKSSEAAIQQSEAQLQQNQVNLDHTIIQSPIDGLVISRAMDVGQTVSASMSAPTLFTIAADLTKMKVIAGVDESDVGRIRPDQHVTFRVDAYPNEAFSGTVEQVRLEPKMQQNVVTYQTVISVPNPELKLKPGMTANLNIEISRVDGALRVPNAALRFRPTNDMYTALGLTPPPDVGRGGRGGPNPGRGGRDGAPGGPSAAPGPGGSDGGASTSASPATPAGRGPARTASAEAAASPAPRGARGATSDLTPEMLIAARGQDPTAASDANAGGRSRRGNRGADPTATDPQSGFTGRGNGGPGGAPGGRGGSGFTGGPGGGQGGFAGGQGGFGGPNGGRGGNRNGGQGGFGGRGGNGAGQGAAFAQNGQGRGGRQNGAAAAQPAPPARSGATIDQLFPPIVRTETRGRVWTWDKDKKELTQHNLRLGISDGQATQIIDAGDLAEGAELVTNIITAAAVRPTGAQQGNPFFQGGGGRGPGGPGGFGGGGGGRPGGGRGGD